MAGYRCYFFGANGTTLVAEDLECISDADALVQARRKFEELPMFASFEVWLGDHRIHREARGSASSSARGGMPRERALHSVLIVEDDPTFARTVETHLMRAGFDVEVASDTMDALNKVEARRYDMFIVDLAMPSGKPSGLSFARMVRYQRPTSNMVFITGYPELAGVATQLPGKVFTKPVELDAVASEVRAQLAN
jgi:CheY-like chemotaxis protein